MRRNREPGLVPGMTFADRYEVIREIGRGAYGVVYAVEDRISGGPAALKVLRGNRSQRSSNRWREAATLRRLRIPGVVTFYDEGVARGLPYVAMEFVDGVPFFEPREPVTWDELEPHAVRLLELLAVVHRQGVVHGDLKPPNVLLVDTEPGIKLLDFGLSVSTTANALELDEGGRGTPIYMAPELFRDGRTTVKTDLFAVGTMLFEAMAGRPFFITSNLLEWVRRLNTEGPPPLADVADVPAAAARLVDALLRPADDRPSSALAALELVGRARTSPGVRSLGREPWTSEELETLFRGIEPGFHLRSGPAAELFRRTGGDPAEVAAELKAWTNVGFAHHDGEGFSVSSRALAALRGGLVTRPDAQQTLGERSSFVDADTDAEEWVARQVARGTREARRGNSDGARSAFREALLVCRAEGIDRRQVVEAWADFALASPRAGVVEEALWAIDDDSVRAQLLEVHRLGLLGRRDSAAAALEGFGPLSDPRLEARRLGSLLNVRSFEDPEYGAIHGRVEALCNEHPDQLADLRDAVRIRDAIADYARGRYEVSARKLLEVAERAVTPASRLSALFHAAWSTMDAFDFEQAKELARQTMELAMELGQTHLELLSRVGVVTAEYRAGRDVEVDSELLEAVAQDGGLALRTAAALVASAGAWRRGALAQAAELASDVARHWSPSVAYGGLDLLAVFSGYLNGATASPELVEAVERCGAPRLRAQMLWFLAESAGAVPSDAERWRAQAAELVGGLPDVRLEVVSVGELLQP